MLQTSAGAVFRDHAKPSERVKLRSIQRLLRKFRIIYIYIPLHSGTERTTKEAPSSPLVPLSGAELFLFPLGGDKLSAHSLKLQGHSFRLRGHAGFMPGWESVC